VIKRKFYNKISQIDIKIKTMTKVKLENKIHQTKPKATQSRNPRQNKFEI
jgi:hypothetical protein